MQRHLRLTATFVLLALWTATGSGCAAPKAVGKAATGIVKGTGKVAKGVVKGTGKAVRAVTPGGK